MKPNCETWKILILFMVFGLLFPQALMAQNSAGSEEIAIKTPPGTRLEISGVKIRNGTKSGISYLSIDAKTQFPITIRARGPLGGAFQTKVASKAELKNLTISEGIVRDPHPDPKTLPHLPKLCPRLQKVEGGKKNASAKDSESFVYEGRQDSLNHTPTFHLFDPDATDGKQPLTVQLLDGKNVLTVSAIRVRHDYEDAKIVKYQKRDPKTGKLQIFREGNGGFYANLQYAVIPYSEKVLNIDAQTLLHLAQGSLKKVGKESMRPMMRTRSFLPGPFLSQKKFHYEMCEWGDTAHQAKDQKLNYRDLIIWDWDFPVSPNDRILLIVWEGDEEAHYPNKQYLPPNYLIDDFVGIFDISRSKTIHPLTLKNPRGDFEITLLTQDVTLNK